MAAALGLFVRVRANGRVCGPHASGCLRSARRYYTLADTMRQHSMVNMQSVNVCSLNAPCFARIGHCQWQAAASTRPGLGGYIMTRACTYLSF